MNIGTETKILVLLGALTLLLIGVGVFFLSDSNPPPAADTSRENLVSSESFFKGNPQASIEIVEFSDFQCSACGMAYPIIKQVVDEYGDRVKFVYRHYPIASHRWAQKAAEAAEAAGLQGKFWEFHDKIFESQDEWSGSQNAQELFEGYAKDLGLDVEKFKGDRQLKAISEKIRKDRKDGNEAGVSATPTFFVDGEQFTGVLSFSEFKEEIEKRL